ncbi:TPA: fimbrial biogenesis outer membrane usher protein, partial [Escherichia coli]|nr:fimbrial biogenesis outer membrane usher protein [Escherichia coli]
IDYRKIKIKDNGYGYIDFKQSELNYKFNFYGMELTLYVPQKSLIKKNSELSHDSRWDDGVDAIILNYDAKAYHRDSHYSSPSNDSYSIFLKPGVNIGAWRFRHSGIWQKGYDNVTSYQNSYSYVERDIRKLRSKLLIGESNTSADIFSSIPFKGMRLSTSDSMIPFLDRAHVPVVKGIANSLSKVDISQNGYIIYSSEVPAGPFELTDIPASEGSDLYVTVTGSNGDTQEYIVPYNAPAISIKGGSVKYEVVLGEYRPYSSYSRNDNFVSSTVTYGFNDYITGYIGSQASNKYRTGTFGLGFNLYGYGAFSLDGTYSENEYKEKEKGNALRFRYNKSIDKTKTLFNLSVNQYTSSKYSSFSEAMDKNDISQYKRKNDISINLRQELFDFGDLDLTFSRRTFWDRGDTESYGDVNYSTTLWGNGSLSLGWNRILSSSSKYKNEDYFSATVSLPIGRRDLGLSSLNFRSQLIAERDESITNLSSVNGGINDKFYWSFSYGSNNKKHDNNRVSFNTSFRNSFGYLNGVYNYSSSLTQFGIGMSGGVVLHNGGLTFGHQINGAAALVDVGGSGNIGITNRPGVKTDNKGFAIIQSLNTYRENDIYINVSDLDDQTDIINTVATVIPTDNALVSAKYSVIKGKKVLLRIFDSNNMPVPFGAVVSLEGGENSGIVADNGEVYLSGLSDKGVLYIQWGKGIERQCKANYSLDKNIPNDYGLYKTKVRCLN